MPAPGKMATAGGLNVTAKIKGASVSRANVRKMTKAVRKKFYEQMVAIAEDILAHSNKTYVPKLTGDLKRSGKVLKHPGRYPSVEIGFGGGAVDYAVVQHENPFFKHPRGGSYKYLEFAVRDFKPRIDKRMAEAVSAEIHKYDMRGKFAG